MRSKLLTLALAAALITTLTGTTFAKGSGAKHVAVGTVTSMDANQLVISKGAKGKEQPMTFKLDASTQKSGNVANGSKVTIQYRTENNQNIATSVRERSTNAVKANTTTKAKTSSKKS